MDVVFKCHLRDPVVAFLGKLFKKARLEEIRPPAMSSRPAEFGICRYFLRHASFGNSKQIV